MRFPRAISLQDIIAIVDRSILRYDTGKRWFSHIRCETYTVINIAVFYCYTHKTYLSLFISKFQTNTYCLPFTTVACSVVSTVYTLSSEIVADVGVPVTLARPTVREPIESWVTYIADTLMHIGDTQTLSRLDVTEIVTGSNGMTVTSCRSENKFMINTHFHFYKHNIENVLFTCRNIYISYCKRGPPPTPQGCLTMGY